MNVDSGLGEINEANLSGSTRTKTHESFAIRGFPIFRWNRIWPWSKVFYTVGEEIPSKIWKEIGGELTPAGKERLLSKDYGNRPDDLNPNYIFTLTATALLAEALRGGFDLKALVRRELANRGQDEKGDWVGFDKAAQIHKIKK